MNLTAVNNFDLKFIFITEEDDRIKFLSSVVGKRFRFVEKKSVPEKDVLKEISYEYWQTGKKYNEQEIKPSLIECIQKLFPGAIRKKIKKKKTKVYPLHFDSFKGIRAILCVSVVIKKGYQNMLENC